MDEDKEYRMCKIIKQTIDIKNVTAVFFFTQLFKLSSSIEFSMSLIERCFSIISDSTNFLELDIVSVVKILSSNELSIDSEIEVADVAEKWLLYKTHERSKFAYSPALLSPATAVTSCYELRSEQTLLR